MAFTIRKKPNLQRVGILVSVVFVVLFFLATRSVL